MTIVHVINDDHDGDDDNDDHDDDEIDDCPSPTSLK